MKATNQYGIDELDMFFPQEFSSFALIVKNLL